MVVAAWADMELAFSACCLQIVCDFLFCSQNKLFEQFDYVLMTLSSGFVQMFWTFWIKGMPICQQCLCIVNMSSTHATTILLTLCSNSLDVLFPFCGDSHHLVFALSSCPSQALAQRFGHIEL